MEASTTEHKNNSKDIGTQLAHERTDLAIERSYLGSERTHMAWIRTSLSMISFGFTIGKLKEIVGATTTAGVLGATRTVSTQQIAELLVTLGTITLVASTWQHWRRTRELRAMGLQRQLSISTIVAILLAAIGGFALTAIVMAF